MYTINLKTRLCAVHKRFCLASHSSLFLYSVFKVRTCGEQVALCSVLVVLGVRVLTRCKFFGFSAVVGSNGLEPSTSRLSGVRSNHLSYEPMSVAVSVTICGQPVGGDEQNRTVDPLLARQVLSQLSYTPVFDRFASTVF